MTGTRKWAVFYEDKLIGEPTNQRSALKLIVILNEYLSNLRLGRV